MEAREAVAGVWSPHPAEPQAVGMQVCSENSLQKTQRARMDEVECPSELGASLGWPPWHVFPRDPLVPRPHVPGEPQLKSGSGQ